MTARGQRSHGVIKARCLLLQPLELHSQVIISKMKNIGQSCQAPTRGSKTAQFPPTLKAQHSSDRSWAHPATHVVLRRVPKPWTCATTSQDDWEYFQGPHWAQHIVNSARGGVKRRPSLSWYCQTQILALHEHFRNFPALSVCDENSQLFVIAGSHITHVQTVICLLYSFPVSEHC